MRLISANVFGINAREKSDYFINIARNYDIVFFQETKLTKTAVQFLKLKVGNQHLIEASCADSARRGVVTIIKKFPYKPNSQDRHMSKRSICSHNTQNLRHHLQFGQCLW